MRSKDQFAIRWGQNVSLDDYCRLTVEGAKKGELSLPSNVSAEASVLLDYYAGSERPTNISTNILEKTFDEVLSCYGLLCRATAGFAPVDGVQIVSDDVKRVHDLVINRNTKKADAEAKFFETHGYSSGVLMVWKSTHDKIAKMETAATNAQKLKLYDDFYLGETVRKGENAPQIEAKKIELFDKRQAEWTEKLADQKSHLVVCNSIVGRVGGKLKPRTDVESYSVLKKYAINPDLILTECVDKLFGQLHTAYQRQCDRGLVTRNITTEIVMLRTGIAAITSFTELVASFRAKRDETTVSMEDICGALAKLAETPRPDDKPSKKHDINVNLIRHAIEVYNSKLGANPSWEILTTFLRGSLMYFLQLRPLTADTDAPEDNFNFIVFTLFDVGSGGRQESAIGPKLSVRDWSSIIPRNDVSDVDLQLHFKEIKYDDKINEDSIPTEPPDSIARVVGLFDRVIKFPLAIQEMMGELGLPLLFGYLNVDDARMDRDILVAKLQEAENHVKNDYCRYATH